MTRRRRAILGLPALIGLAAAFSCSKSEPDRGGLMLLIMQDGPLELDRLDVQVSVPGGRPLLDTSYRISSEPGSSEATLPTTVAVVSNGNSAATVLIRVSGWKNETPLDVRDAIVRQIPVDRVASVRIVLSGRCSGLVEEVDGKAVSACGDGTGEETCDPETGMCVSAEVDGSTLDTYESGDEDKPPGSGGSTGGAGGAGSPGGAAGRSGGGTAGESGSGGEDATGGTSGIGGGGKGGSGGNSGGTAGAGTGGTTGEPVCGNRNVEPNDETCDDGNTGDGDGCSSTCAKERGWTCDDGAPTNCDEICGDGLLVGAELMPGGCDDDNTATSDGCNGSCRVESEWFCTDEPSICEHTCGNGLLDGLEGCDDPNSVSGDGCASCTVENGWTCMGEPSMCMDVDECDASPCLHSGSCANEPGSFSCDCTGTGYSGTTCDMEIDECSTTPCQHNGVCSNLVNAYSCDCTGTGFNGPDCDNNIDDCTGTPCLHGGVCNDGVNDFTCACTGTGYSGSTCNAEIDECATNADNCHANANCTNTPPGSFTCTCNSGYMGNGVSCSRITGLSCGGMTGTECQGESCCTTIQVPDNQVFTLGQTVESPSSLATVAAFKLDKYEVTMGRFQRFVTAYDAWRGGGNPKAGDGQHPLIANSGWQSQWPLISPASLLTSTSGVLCDSTYQTWSAGNAQLPMNCVTWYEAFAFCIWDGQRLPTEAEWEDAAAGGMAGRLYPWGATPVPNNTDGSRAVYNCLGNGNAGDCVLSDILAVGSKATGAGLWGHRDLGGSMSEWVLDWFATYPGSCTNCAAVTSGTARVLRGGSWYDVGNRLRTPSRYSFDPALRGADFGFRCARTEP